MIDAGQELSVGRIPIPKRRERAIAHGRVSAYQYGLSTAPHFGCLQRTGSYSSAGGMPSICFNGVYLFVCARGANEKISV